MHSLRQTYELILILFTLSWYCIGALLVLVRSLDCVMLSLTSSSSLRAADASHRHFVWPTQALCLAICPFPRVAEGESPLFWLSANSTLTIEKSASAELPLIFLADVSAATRLATALCHSSHLVSLITYLALPLVVPTLMPFLCWRFGGRELCIAGTTMVVSFSLIAAPSSKLRV